ncbi:MAG: formyltetrahydrofolate deformylase [Mariprofundaceae bacterium]|nr:formyltetrahydrofolate deformylase [Mariprofundaceae bacterium]
MQDSSARLLIRCEDQPGIVAAVSNFFYHHGANITDLDQHCSDPQGGTFFMRLEFQTPDLDMSGPLLEKNFGQAVAKPFAMQWQLHYAAKKKKMAIMVSKFEHALMELLWRHAQGELDADITMVISNHPDMRQATERFGIPFYEIPVQKDNKEQAEQEALKLLEGVDLVVLARYMQILSANFINHFPEKIINIHHSFLPAFRGANPYQQAYDKGVKLIGATAHYVTPELDMGPIIEQGVKRITHRQSKDSLKETGQHLERQVLARAVICHLQDRVLVDGCKTLVF